MKPRQLCRITCVTDAPARDELSAALSGLSVPFILVQPCRTLRFASGRDWFGFSGRMRLEERPAAITRFWAETEDEEGFLEAACAAAGLGPGRHGSVYSEAVSVVAKDGFALTSRDRGAGPLPGTREDSGAAKPRKGLTAVACIVQRGLGNALARSILEMGFSVPAISFGEGTGLRSKLGLLRVTVPSDKECLSFLVADQDAREAIAMASDAIGLELPGRGFIYQFPARHGLADTRIHEDRASYHVASMEQVIAAIDEISGSPAWRRRSASVRVSERGKCRVFDSGMASLSITCGEGWAEEYVRMAMRLGAGGATLAKSVGAVLGPAASREPCESSDLVVGAELGERIMESLGASGFFEETELPILELAKVTRSAAYKPRQS